MGNRPHEQIRAFKLMLHNLYPRNQVMVELYACDKKIEILLGCMITPMHKLCMTLDLLT